LLVSIRDGTSTGKQDLDTAAEKMSTENLFKLLKASDSMDDATIVSEILKELWKAHVDSELRWRLDNAIGHMLSGNTEVALSLFGELVEEDPKYAEAWNKASTCEFMMGNMDGALAAAQKTLELIPNHYQALNGLGLIHYENKELSSAITCFHKSMQIDPWSPVSSRLAACQDTLHARRGGAIKGSDQEWKAP
jgi:tetratricopeptide (TPR) repeat protein